MAPRHPKATTVAEYLSRQPKDVRAAFERIRRTVKSVAPEASERISYGMPTFFVEKALLGYAAHAKHCSIFPWSGLTLRTLRDELSDFSTSAGTVRFTPERPIPAALLKRILKARLAEIRSGMTRTAVNRAWSELPEGLSAPARRALAGAKITTLKELRSRKEPEIAALHGMGPKALAQLRAALKKAGLAYKK
ncbi:MAG: hypothetical protein F9K22_11135 [Bacteroidetes bacterium]|nr:MAG: hypothetical protein F9K22_11135 [Bacteroidota bacterium]